jgi:hypothetical protein
MTLDVVVVSRRRRVPLNLVSGPGQHGDVHTHAAVVLR